MTTFLLGLIMACGLTQVPPKAHKTNSERKLSPKLQRYVTRLTEHRARIAGGHLGRLETKPTDPSRIKLANSVKTVGFPELMRVGDIGWAEKSKVISVVDDRNYVAKVTWKAWAKYKTLGPGGSEFFKLVDVSQDVWISGVSTRGVVDDGTYAIDYPLEVVGTRKYQTALGARTVYEIKPLAEAKQLASASLRLPPIKAAAIPAASPKPKPKPKPTPKPKPKLRLWRNSTGEYSLRAQFVRIEGGKVFLKKTDRSVISLPIGKLSKKDQAYIESIAKTK